MENVFLILIVVAVLAAYIYVRSPTVKGAMGEARVTSQLEKSLNPDEYVILNDLTLPASNGTTQIDHVVVSQFGVFVVETKNMKVGFSVEKNKRDGRKL